MPINQNLALRKDLAPALNHVQHQAFREMLYSLLSHPKSIKFLSERPTSYGLTLVDQITSKGVSRKEFVSEVVAQDLVYCFTWLDGLSVVFSDEELFYIAFPSFQLLIQDSPVAAGVLAQVMNWPLKSWN